MTPLDLARAFLVKAGDDQAVLEIVVDDARISDGIFGFHAQQAVEKCLKAVLAIDQERPEHTHDLVKLSAQCGQAGHELPEGVAAELDHLSEFAVDPRYPFIELTIDRVASLWLVTSVRRWAADIFEAAGGTTDE